MEQENLENDFGSIRSQSVPEIITQQIRDAILGGKLRPGERLIEQKLAARFGVGQPTVREALSDLEHLGFVRKKQNRGTYVTEFTQDDIRKNLEVRIALEALSVQRAARNITDQNANELRATINQMETAASQFDLSAFHKADASFHQKIWALADNEYLTAALERIVLSLFAFALLERKPSDAVMTHVSHLHRKILGALLTRDPQTARKGFVRATLGFWRKYQNIEIDWVD